MPDYTVNLNLEKPTGNENFRRAIINANMDLIDAAVAAKETPVGAQNKATAAENSAKTYADNRIAALIAAAPGALDTLKELADALGNDANFAATITNMIAALQQQQSTHEAENATTAAKGHIQLATTAEATAGTDTAKAVTAAGLKAALAALVVAAPSTLDTLDELAAALGDDPNFATTITNLIGGKIDKNLATAANDFLVASGNGAWAKKTLAEVRTLLGCLLNTGFVMSSGAANFNDLEVIRPFIRDYAEKIGSTSATTGTCNFDLTTGNVFAVTPTGNITIGAVNPPANGRAGSATIWLTNDATVYAKTFASSIKWVNSEIPDMSEANKTYGIVLTTLNGGTAYRAACIGPYSV